MCQIPYSNDLVFPFLTVFELYLDLYTSTIPPPVLSSLCILKIFQPSLFSSHPCSQIESSFFNHVSVKMHKSVLFPTIWSKHSNSFGLRDWTFANVMCKFVFCLLILDSLSHCIVIRFSSSTDLFWCIFCAFTFFPLLVFLPFNLSFLMVLNVCGI